MEALIASIINVTILVTLLVYFLRKPLGNFISGRHVSIRDEVKQVTDLLRQAQDRYEEFTSKLKAIDNEIVALRDQARQDAKAMRLHVLSDARRIHAMIVSDSRAAAETLYEDLRKELRRDLSLKITDRAEALLRTRLTGDDRIRIRQEFSRQVGSIQ